MNLIPRAARIYNDYWLSIAKYNHWFIQIRYYAVAALLAFLVFFTKILQFELSKTQTIGMALIAIAIFAYNVIFRHIEQKYQPENAKFSPLHFSLLQMICDLITLSLLVYFMGGVEAPFFMFFIFHMIIGSIILPKVLMYVIATIMLLLFSTFSFLEYFGTIPHQVIKGLYSTTLYDDLYFVVSFILVFAFMIYITIYLANKIAAELYTREGQLKLALDHVNEAETSKQKYIMAVVHELKSPIAAASSHLGLINGGILGEISDAVSDKVGKANTRLIEAIDNINNILRVSKFKLLNQLENEDLDLEKMILVIKEGLQSNLTKKRQILNFKFETKHPVISGDRVLLNLALSNLMSNAVKYTPENGIIAVKVYDDQEGLIIEIMDNGIGIPSQDMIHIFEDFYRASNAKASKIEGTGTGLAIVQQIVENHNGKITVESPSPIGNKYKPGTNFKIVFRVN